MFAFSNSKNKQLTKILLAVLVWTSILPRINAVLSLVIYFTRSSRMRCYYYKLLNFKSTKIHLQRSVAPIPNIGRKVSPASYSLYTKKSQLTQKLECFETSSFPK